MKKKIAVLLAAVLLLSCAACAKGGSITQSGKVKSVGTPKYPSGTDSTDSIDQLSDDFLNALKDFSYETSSLLLGTGENGNHSPLSLYFALAIAATGAKGETAGEMLSLLRVRDSAELSEQCSMLYKMLYSDGEISKLKIANSLWLKNYFEFKDDYIDNAVESFYASLFEVDFTDDETAKAMSEWVSENTSGTLNPNFEFNPLTVMTILNTVYFFDEWSKSFNEEKTEEDTFYLSDGSEVSCDFMNADITTWFLEEEDYTRASLSLKDNGEMVFILPKDGVSVSDLMSSPDKVAELFETQSDGLFETGFKLPKFSFDCSYDLIDTLKELGVLSAFEETAEFGGITDEQIFISSVRQQTHIAVNENGVEASAFTQLGFDTAAFITEKAEMVLDHPFIFGITSQDGVLLFVGVCENPLG